MGEENVSWAISATGTKSAVSAEVAAQSVNDQPQGEAVKAFVLAALESIPTNGVEVKATGHQDETWSSLTVEVKSLNLLLDTTEPAVEA